MRPKNTYLFSILKIHRDEFSKKKKILSSCATLSSLMEKIHLKIKIFELTVFKEQNFLHHVEKSLSLSSLSETFRAMIF